MSGATTAGQGPAVLYLKGVSKRFGSVTALDNVDFVIRAGEIHGLLGENGAGKSTLMKILYGLYRPDEGEMFLEGRGVRLRSPEESIVHGIGMVHQVSTLVPEFTAVENIVLGTRENRFRLSLGNERKKIRELSEHFGLSFPMDSKVSRLSAGIKQKIEIVRALYRGARVLILDEPTTSLVASEFEQLLESLQGFVAKGLTVVFITHKIREVLAACHAATVLRKGKVQGRLAKQEMTQESLVKLMFAEKDIRVTESALPKVELPPSNVGAVPVLSLRGVTVPGSDDSPGLTDVSLEVYPGEILGVAAVSGNGEKEIAEVTVNPRRLTAGDILIAGESIKNESTLTVFAKGVSYTPEDRIQEGILTEGSIAENMLLGHQAEERFSWGGVFVNWPNVREATKAAVADYNVDTPSIDLSIRRLSGGNVQKAILSRAFLNQVRLLITHNPTSGLDISTVEFIFGRLVERRVGGAAILWVNEDLDELMILSDRIAVLHGGRITGVFRREEFDKYEIGKRMLGGEL
jgi:general nucleoside transport system ATP-binding protein